MRKLSRGAMAAIAAAVAIPAGVAIAKSFDHGGWHRLSPEARERLNEGRLAMAKTALKLSAEQEKLWGAVETEVRSGFKAMSAKRAEFDKLREERRKDGADAKKPDMAERFERMSQNMTERADRMKAFTAAFKPFYASLTDEQKEVLRPLVKEMMPGMGPGGRGHHGRWAFGGGWGERGGWGRHEGRGGHGWGRHHERGGPGEEGGAGGGRGGDQPPPPPQNMPDSDAPDGDAPASPDNL